MSGSTGGSGGARATPWELARLALLRPGSIQDKLAVIAEGDPLGLFALGVARVRARRLLLEPNRVHDEGVFHVVSISPTLSREEDLESWLVARIDEAIDQVLRRDAEALHTEEIPPELALESADYLSACFDLDPETAFRAAIRFNGLSERTRRAYFALFLEGRSVAECLERGLGPREDLGRLARLAIETVLSEVPSSRFAGDPDDTLGGRHV